MPADDDALVAGLFAVDGGVHVDDAVVPLGKAGDLHGGAVGDLLVQAQQQLLPHQFPHHLAFRLVAGLAVGEELGALRGILPQLLHQVLQAVAGVGGDGNDGVKAVPGLVVGGDDGQQLCLFNGVDLVDAEDGGDMLLLNALDQGQLRAAHMGNGLHQKQGAVHVGEAGGDHLHHIVPQGAFGLVEARGIQQDELGVSPVHHAVDAVAGGLGLVGNDGHLLPHQRVGEAGLAHVGAAADGDHGGFRNVHSR